MKTLVIIGLDGGNWTLFKALIKEGYLKNFNKIIKRGIVRNLKTVFPPHTSAAWSSFATGKNPGKHGIFEWINLKHNSISNRACIDSKTFYEILVDKGYSVGLVNLPLSAPSKIKGDIIASYIKKEDGFIFPKSLRKKFNFKNYKSNLSSFQKLKNLPENVLKVTKSQVEIVKEMYEKKNYNFFFYLFTATDLIQHSYLGTILNKKPKKIYKRCIKVFEEIDNFFEWLIKKNINLIVMSDHGFKKYSYVFYVNRWLELNNLLIRSKKDDVGMFFGANSKIIKVLKFNKLVRNLSLKFLNIVKKIIPSNIFIRVEANLADGIDISKTKAFCPRSELSGIYLNDYRFENIVSKQEFETIRKKIIDKLNEESIVKAVKKEEVYSGKNLKYAPDILLIQKDHKVQRSLVNQTIKKIDIFNHNDTGIFLAYGDILNKPKQKLSILDIAPTIIDYFKIKPPNDMDGSNLKLFKSNKKFNLKK